MNYPSNKVGTIIYKIDINKIYDEAYNEAVKKYHPNSHEFDYFLDDLIQKKIEFLSRIAFPLKGL